jgi:UDPglucose 6-dehydrogenase
MRIAMIGGGYVGLVSAACFAQFGTDVTVMEVDAEKLAALQQGSMPIYEPGLEKLVAENVAAGRLAFTADLATALHDAEAVFIAVGTPTRRGDGHADLTYVFAAAEQVARALTGYAVIVTKSTVPVGTSRQIAEIVRATRPDLDFDVASNPEFLREGNAIGDFMRPDRVVIGTESERARDVLRQLYRPLYPHDSPHLSDRSENICEQRLLLQGKGETLHQRTQPGFRHRRDQIVKHAALTEQRMDAALGGVGLEHPIIAQRLAGGAEQGQQHHRESVDQP